MTGVLSTIEKSGIVNVVKLPRLLRTVMVFPEYVPKERESNVIVLGPAITLLVVLNDKVDAII